MINDQEITALKKVYNAEMYLKIFSCEINIEGKGSVIALRSGEKNSYPKEQVCDANLVPKFA